MNITKFRTGDRVKFLNDIGEGEIVAFTDKNTALVSTSDGFDIPVLLNELIRVDNGKVQEESRKIKEIEPEIPAVDPGEEREDYIVEDEDISLALLLDRKSTVIKSFLINSSTYYLYYVISRLQEGEEVIFAHGKLEPDTKVALGRLVSLKVDEEIKLKAGILFYGNHYYRYIKPLAKNITIVPSAVYSGELLTENDYFEEDAAIFTLFSFRDKAEEQYTDKLIRGDLSELIELKEKKEKKEVAKKSVRSPEIEEVDLHIESLADNFSSMESGEILEIQMGRFATALETAIIHKIRRIVFIHGIGNGKLKHEIRRTLDRKYPGLKYQDASFREYGYGATMVIIPQ